MIEFTVSDSPTPTLSVSDSPVPSLTVSTQEYVVTVIDVEA